MDKKPKPKPDQRPLAPCDECGKLRHLNLIYSRSGDVMLRLCDACQETRRRGLEAMYRGE